jgi:ubiquinone/menaquinone biosynthesis C-methylase UbiE
MAIFPKIKRMLFPITAQSPSQSQRRLTSKGWAKHYNPAILHNLLQSIRERNLSYQTIEMLKLTHEGDKVLEIGCGTGQTSLYLSLNNRRTTALDFAKPSLQLVDLASQQLNCSVRTVFADASQKLPFVDEEFDIVFQAGLLEHFEKNERVNLLKLWGKVGKKMISIIPNAASIAYRTGKAEMEKNGTWEYGKELPQYSLFQEFFLAGFRVTNEYTIGENHALNFLPKKHYLRPALEKWQKEHMCDDNCGQGYLLVTIGERI